MRRICNKYNPILLSGEGVSLRFLGKVNGFSPTHIGVDVMEARGRIIPLEIPLPVGPPMGYQEGPCMSGVNTG